MHDLIDLIVWKVFADRITLNCYFDKMLLIADY